MEIGTAVATNAINKVIVDPLLQQIDDVIHLVQNRGLLQAKVERMELLLQDTRNVFENQQRTLPASIQHCLDSTRDAIREAKSLIDRSQLKQQSLGCLFCKPRVSRHIRKCNSSFYQNLTELQTLFSTFASAHQMGLTSEQPPAKELLQPLPEWGLVGVDIKSAEKQLQTWLAEGPHLRKIGVFGMAGVGKTTLLKWVYNFYKVGDLFDVVVWVTVSQDYKIWDLQHRIAKALNLDLSGISDFDTDALKMMLSASLIKKKFLLVLDDIWSALDLPQKLGVTFGDDKDSKVVFSTRDKNLAIKEANKYLKVEPLSNQEGRTLFNRVAFKDDHVPEELKEFARDFADECEGLPLAITVVAAAMCGETSVDEWNTSLSLMKNADPSFPETHPRVDQELYRRLRWSYDHLPNANLKKCFLYCAMFPEDKRIHVDFMILMWIAEGFVKSKEATHSKDMDLGHRYVTILIDRGLFQSFNFEKQSKDIIVNKPVNIWKERYITVHDVLRDMAIYIAEKEENFICSAGQQLKDFPRNPSQDCKRISLAYNRIEYLPRDFECTKLVNLMLYGNPLTCAVPENFLINLSSLRVLDLSQSPIESVPTSLTQLTSLKVLDLNSTGIKELPQDICSLSKLLYLDLSSCKNITSLPCTVGKLPQLQYLLLEGCNNLVLPAEISQVTSLRRLSLDIGTSEEALKDPTNVVSLKGLTILKELSLSIFLDFEAHELMGTWFELRNLRLKYKNYVNDDLPQGMQNMKRLESFRLDRYEGVNLPNWICQFQHLQRLELFHCSKLEDLFSLERLPNLKFLKLNICNELQGLGIGCSGKPGGFPMLEMLVLKNMPKLQSITETSSEGGVLKEGTLLKLRVLKIFQCPLLRKLPMGIEMLPNFIALYGSKSWWKHIIWEDSNMEIYLQNRFKTKNFYNYFDEEEAS